MQSIRDICDVQFGIGKLSDASLRQTLYRRLTQIAPGERIPWRRLIRELIADEQVDDAEYAIKDAEEAVGRDSPIDRYKVRILVLRAEKTERISAQDRVALLRKAYEVAMRNLEFYRWDKYSYRTLCDVAVELLRRGESAFLLDEAIGKLRDAAARILDPDMNRDIRTYENIRAREG
jgi:hypothetical protein